MECSNPMAQSNGVTSDPSLWLDLGIHGVWQPQLGGLLKACVIETDDSSYGSCAPQLTTFIFMNIAIVLGSWLCS